MHEISFRDAVYGMMIHVLSIASTRERARAEHVFTRRQTSEFQVFEVFPPKCEV